MKINLCSKADFKTNNMLEVTHSGHSYLIAKVNDDFFYSSNTNNKWMTNKELEKWVENNFNNFEK